MPTRVILVRHGATSLSAEDKFSGSSDPPLSDDGQRQAQALGRRLSAEPITAIYCSPMQRAAQTASAIAAPHRLKPIPMNELREVDHGHWEGLRQDVGERDFAEEHARWSDDPFDFAPQGGETGRSVLNRALPALTMIVNQHPQQTVVIVSHKATIRLLAASVLGLDPRRYRDRLAQDLACVNVISFDGSISRAKLMLWNDVSHYAERNA